MMMMMMMMMMATEANDVIASCFAATSLIVNICN
jgi:hypothetical protein